MELIRVGQLKCTYSDDNTTPLSFKANPNSYVGKLLQAYRMLGGVPENDMLLRTRENTVYLNRGASIDDAPRYTNGRVNRGGQIFDRPLGLSVEKLKRWQLESIKAKREHLEFKIKRALDYADQLEQEVELLRGLIDGFSIDDQIMQVEVTMEEPGRANVPPGVGDRFGLGIGPVGDSTMEDVQQAAVEGNQRIT